MLYSIILFLFILCCITIITIILMQSGRGEGLAGVFGGGEIQSMLGTQATNILEKITWGAVGAFFLLSVVLSLMSTQNSSSIVDKIPVQQAAPAAAKQAQQAQSQTATQVPAGEQSVPVAVPEGTTDAIPAETTGEVPVPAVPTE